MVPTVERVSTIARSTSRSRPWWRPSLVYSASFHRNSNTLAPTLPFRARGWRGAANIDLTSATLICPNDTTTVGPSQPICGFFALSPVWWNGIEASSSRKSSHTALCAVPAAHSAIPFCATAEYFCWRVYSRDRYTVGQVVWIVGETLCSILWRRSIFHQGMRGRSGRMFIVRINSNRLIKFSMES